MSTGLTEEQLANFQRDGYIVLPSLLKSELDEIMNNCHGFMRKWDESNANSEGKGSDDWNKEGWAQATDAEGNTIPGRLLKIQCVANEEPSVLDVMANPKILDKVYIYIYI